MKDADIPSDDALIEWASDLITDLVWHEAYEARKDRNVRWQARVREAHEQARRRLGRT